MYVFTVVHILTEIVLIPGVIHLQTDYTICKKGDILTPNQARLLVSTNIVLFHFTFSWVLSRAFSQFSVISLKKQHKTPNSKLIFPSFSCFQKLFGYKMADFHITLNSMWSNDGTFEEFDVTPDDTLLPQQSIVIKREYSVVLAQMICCLECLLHSDLTTF